MRELAMASGVWRYRIGRSVTRIRGPNGETWNVGTHEVNGRIPDNLDRGRHKKTTDGMVTPADVRQFIESRIH